MSTVANVRYEFRCTSCYQSLHVAVDDAGNTIECPLCQKSVTAPEATEGRIQRAAEADEHECVATKAGMLAETEEHSSEELAKQCEKQSAAQSGDRCGAPEKMGESPFRRLLAGIVDGISNRVS